MILLELTDGTTTLDLAWMLTEYLPKPPQTPEEGELDPHATIEESLHLYLRAGSMEAALETMRQVDRWFAQARAYQRRKVGARLYARCRPDDESAVYRAEILDGHTEFIDHPLDWGVQHLHSLEISLFWKRRIWEADSEIELPLLNGSVGAKQTGGVTIYNHDDAGAGHDDWVEIAGVDVAGVLPTPVRLVVTNSFATDQTSRLYLGHSAYNTFANFLHFLEGESSTGGGTPTVEASCSGGNYMAITWAGSLEATVAKWALSAAQAQACGGRWHRVLARFKTLPTSGITARLAVSLTGGSPLLSTSESLVLGTGDYLQELGAVRIPPWLPGESSLAGVDVKFLATKAGGGALDLDYLALMPTDSYRVIAAAGDTGAINTSAFVDDGILDLAYVQAIGGTKTGQLSTFGSPLLLVPGRTQRLYVLAANEDGLSETLRTHSVRAYYRPRRLTL